jgi:[ribosomal protein S18]-alanine N-acetyltransferase
VTALRLLTLTPDNFPLFQHRLMYIERNSFLSPWTLRSFKNELLNPISCIWGALAGSGFAGFVCFWSVAGEIHLLNIAVAPEERGKGIGGFLLARVIEQGENTRVSRIWLEVRPSNSAALTIYRKADFVEEGRRVGYYSDTGEDAIVMSRAFDFITSCQDREVKYVFESCYKRIWTNRKNDFSSRLRQQ